MCKSLVNKLNFKFSQTRNIFATYKGSHLILVVICGTAWFLINQNPCFCTILCNELHFISDLYCINQKVDKNYFHDYFIADEWLTDNGAEINSSAHDFVSKLPSILIWLTVLATERSQKKLARNNKAHCSWWSWS